MRFLVYVALGGSALLAAGCTSKEQPAKQAVASAETALGQVRPDAQKYAPEHLRTAETDLDAMKQQLAREDYSSVLSSVPRLNEELKTLQEAIVSRQSQLAAATHEWEDLKDEVPKLLDAIDDRLDNLSHGKLPKDVTKQAFDAAKASLDTMKSQWDEATAAADSGNPTEAADKGRAVQAEAKEVSGQLGASPV